MTDMSQPVTPTVSVGDDIECCPNCGIPLGVPLVHSDGCELIIKPAWPQLIADRDEAIRDSAEARAELGAAIERFEDAESEIRELAEVNRVLTSERDLARKRRDELSQRDWNIRQILIAADHERFASPNIDLVAAISWLVDDWRIERSANEIDRAAAGDVDQADTFDQWAIIELMGHRRLAGRVREVQLAGHGYLRLDIPASGDDPSRTQFIAPGSVYALHKTGEETARAAAAQWRPEPVQRWELPGLAKPVDVDEDDDPFK